MELTPHRSSSSSTRRRPRTWSQKIFIVQACVSLSPRSRLGIVLTSRSLSGVRQHCTLAKIKSSERRLCSLCALATRISSWRPILQGVVSMCKTSALSSISRWRIPSRRTCTVSVRSLFRPLFAIVADARTRVGRTGRAGKQGTAITFLTNDDDEVMCVLSPSYQITHTWHADCSLRNAGTISSKVPYLFPLSDLPPADTLIPCANFSHRDIEEPGIEGAYRAGEARFCAAQGVKGDEAEAGCGRPGLSSGHIESGGIRGISAAQAGRMLIVQKGERGRLRGYYMNERVVRGSLFTDLCLHGFLSPVCVLLLVVLYQRGYCIDSVSTSYRGQILQFGANIYSSL